MAAETLDLRWERIRSSYRLYTRLRRPSPTKPEATCYRVPDTASPPSGGLRSSPFSTSSLVAAHLTAVRARPRTDA
ncbi:hypothetical protein U1Q18_024318 [Sarracenia purpurea var. burkii]